MPNIDLIFKIAGVGIIISILGMVLKQANKEEQGQMMSLVGVVIVLMIVVQLVSQLFDDVRTMLQLY